MKNVALHNMGCKVNSYETEGMRQLLQEKGYHIVPFDEVADIYIINTCTVTNIADRKSRQMLHRAKQRNPRAVVVAVGCYVQTGRELLEKDDSVDLIVGNNRKKDIVEILEKYLNEAARDQASGGDAQAADKSLGGESVLDINHTYEYEEMRLGKPSEHTRAFIKIQDGCNQFCSYCAIPYARGRVRSRREEDVLDEARAMAESGCREIVLTGIHISSYGVDFGEKDRLYHLVESLHELEGIERIRLGSLEPRIVTQDLADRLAALPKVCPHFHLSLQSGCDETLRRMNRHYTTGEYYNSVECLRKAYARPAVTTDVIVGFPGETEEEFKRTRAFLERVGFYEMHIFQYSRRAGTAAANMPGQVPDEVKAARSGELLTLAGEQSKEFRRAYIGGEAVVLTEEERKIEGASWLIGHTGDYVKVALKQEGVEGIYRPNSLIKVKISEFLTDDILVGEYSET